MICDENKDESSLLCITNSTHPDVFESDYIDTSEMMFQDNLFSSTVTRLPLSELEVEVHSSLSVQCCLSRRELCKKGPRSVV